MRTLLLILSLVSWANPATLWAASPNVVFILADDMGYGDLKAYNPNSKIATPHLDRLAADGLVFTDAHSGGSTCVPSRHSLITGRFAARRDRLNWRAGPVIARGQLTFASVLREQGYRTAMVGKWQIGRAS
ncbi:MAG: sulfatase-like hydrolase/transferase, partial [Pirellulaceae bacterium]